MGLVQACAPARPDRSSVSRTRPSRPGDFVPAETRKPGVEAKTHASLPDEGSLIAKITPQTPPQRQVALRLTEEGRRLLESGQVVMALARLEMTLAIDSTNPYVYYYLAKAHYLLDQYRESLDFLDVAESRLTGRSFWLAEVHTLRGEDFRALGFLQRADSSYAQALRLNPSNQNASAGLSQVRRRMNIPRVR